MPRTAEPARHTETDAALMELREAHRVAGFNAFVLKGGHCREAMDRFDRLDAQLNQRDLPAEERSR